jgi:hypothetical protein
MPQKALLNHGRDARRLQLGLECTVLFPAGGVVHAADIQDLRVMDLRHHHLADVRKHLGTDIVCARDV